MNKEEKTAENQLPKVHYRMYETIKDFLTAGYDKKEFPLIANMLEKNGNYDSAPSGGTVTVLCDEDDSPIGIGIMLRTDAWIEEIAAFEIRKEFRGNGLGSGLLLKMLSDYRSEDMFVFVRALDAKAAAFYYRWMDSWFKVSFGKDDDNEIDYVVRNQKGTVENSIKVLRSCIADRNDENVKIKLFHPNGINKVGNSYKTIDRKYHEKKGDWDGSKLLCADNESTSPLPVSMLFVLNESIANSEKNESLGSAIRSTLAAGALAAGSFVPGTAFASGHGKSHASSNRPNIVYQNNRFSRGRRHMAGYSKEQLRNIIARTLYRECMGTEGETGMRAVATVIFNRGNGIPTEMVNEIKKPRQFSCWNKMSPSDWMPEKFKIREYPNDKWWKLADGIAAEIVNGTFKPVADYDHYHTVSVSPYWSRGKTSQAVKIGNHYFFPSGVIA